MKMSKIELLEQDGQTVLAIRTKTSVEMLPNLIGESYMKILSYLSELGEQPADVPYTAYYNLDMQDLDVEMGFPVARPLPDKNEMKTGTIPPGRVVSYLYTGPYSGMEGPYNKMFQWIQEKGYEPTGVCYEYYLNNPDEVPESELQTRIVMPLK